MPAQGVREGYELGDGVRRLTIDEAVSVGLEDNPDVRSARFRFDATRAGLWEAYGNFLPQLDLTAVLQRSGSGQFVVGGVVVPNPQTYTTFYQFQVTHRLFDAGRDFFRLESARVERRVADADVGLERLRTQAEIKRSYIGARSAEALRNQAGREIERRRLRQDLARARFELGSVTRSDVLQAQIAVSQAQVDSVTQEAEVRRVKLDLLRAMGVEADPDSVELVERVEVFEPEFDVEALVQAALRDHPTVVRLRALRESRESDHWINKTTYLPTLQAAAGFESSASDTSEFLFRDFQDRPVYSLSLTWELFGGFRRYNLTTRSKAELRAADEAVRGAELQVEAAVRQAYLDLLTAYRTRIAREESLELAGKELELAQERYRIGALSFPDLLDSQVTFASAETDYISAGSDFFLALAELEQASAQELFDAAPAAPGPVDAAPADAAPDDIPTRPGPTGGASAGPGPADEAGPAPRDP